MFNKKLNIILGAPSNENYSGFITNDLNETRYLYVVADNHNTLNHYYDHLKKSVTLDHYYDSEIVEFSFNGKVNKKIQEYDKLFEDRDGRLKELVIKNYRYDLYGDAVKPIILFIRDIPKNMTVYLRISASLLKSIRYGIYPIVFDTEDGISKRVEGFLKPEIHISDPFKDDPHVNLGDINKPARLKRRKLKKEKNS